MTSHVVWLRLRYGGVPGLTYHGDCGPVPNCAAAGVRCIVDATVNSLYKQAKLDGGRGAGGTG